MEEYENKKVDVETLQARTTVGLIRLRDEADGERECLLATRLVEDVRSEDSSQYGQRSDDVEGEFKMCLERFKEEIWWVMSEVCGCFCVDSV